MSALPSFFSFSPFGSQTLNTKTLKKHKQKLHIWGKLESNHLCPGKGSGKTCKGFKFTPHTDLQHREGLQEKNNNNNNNKK